MPYLSIGCETTPRAVGLDPVGLRRLRRGAAAFSITLLIGGLFTNALPLQAKPAAAAKSGRHKPIKRGHAVKGIVHKPMPATPASSDDSYVHSLTPVASGPGVIVTEPVTQSSDEDTAAFGAGCSRWLQFALAGTEALGKTPLLGEINRARREMAKPDLRLSVAEAEQAGKILGVTHVAVGSLTGTPGQHVLTYRLWSVQTGAFVGDEIRLTGSDDQIVAALPSLGRQFCSQLSVDTGQIPVSVGATAAEIGQVGRAVWVTSAPFTTAQPGPLLSLSQRLPVAGLWLLGGGLLQDDEQRQAVVKNLLTLAPDNPLIYGEIANEGEGLLIPYQSDLERELKRSPNNYLLAQAKTWLLEEHGDKTAACQAAEQAVRCFPDSPDAWLTLAAPIGDAADALRGGRTADQITEAEWAALHTAYAKWQAAATKATTLDPSFGKSWLRLAKAATFSGDRDTADTAFWKAVQLDTDERGEVYYWGMEMYQPKWNDDEKKLVKVVQMAAEAHYDDIGDIITIAGEIKRLGLGDVATDMMTQIIAARQAASQADPKDPQPHMDLALALQNQHRFGEATTEMQSVIALDPHAAKAHFLLGQLWQQQGKQDVAVTQFREAVRLNANEGGWHDVLGSALEASNQWDDVEKEFREAIRLSPGSATAHMHLGATLRTKQPVEAVTQLQEALRLNPTNPEAWFDLSLEYATEKKYTEAINACKQGLDLDPNDPVAHIWLAEYYNKSGNHAQAAAEYLEMTRQQPKDFMLHQSLGDTYLAMGRIKEARAEWEQVVALAGTTSPAAAAEAKKDLDEHPLSGANK